LSGLCLMAAPITRVASFGNRLRGKRAEVRRHPRSSSLADAHRVISAAKMDVHHQVVFAVQAVVPVVPAMYVPRPNVCLGLPREYVPTEGTAMSAMNVTRTTNALILMPANATRRGGA
jgi:hypothetical protein